MFKIFGKKKLKEDVVASILVNTILDTVEKGFPVVAGIINDAPEFTSNPNISEKDLNKFLLIVIAGNLQYIPQQLRNNQDDRMISLVIDELSKVFNISVEALNKIIREYQTYISKVNHPSKNILYGMSKAVFYKYNLSNHQDEYFKNMRSPNPMFLKRMDEALENFVWNWESFQDKYQISI